MMLIGTFTEAQLSANEDKAACERVKAETGGRIKYFFPKFRHRKGKTVMELYGMTTDEYVNSNII